MDIYQVFAILIASHFLEFANLQFRQEKNTFIFIDRRISNNFYIEVRFPRIFRGPKLSAKAQRELYAGPPASITI